MASKTIIQAEEEFLASKSQKTSKAKKMTKTSSSSTSTATASVKLHNQLDELEGTTKQILVDEQKKSGIDLVKKKSKKSKKYDINNQSVSVKSSFNKFDHLQKSQAPLNVRLKKSSINQANIEILTTDNDLNKTCYICAKPVYKMEEIKAVKKTFHKNCFRCFECKKLLNMDNYHSNEGVIYCAIHFKLLLGPKIVEEDINTMENKQKFELIIRENEPVELPPDVVRASTKSDLGLAELQQLNLRSRFELFENPGKEEHQASNKQEIIEGKSQNGVKLKLAKFQKLLSKDNMEEVEADSQGESNTEFVDDDDGDNDDDNDIDLTELNRERPIGIGQAMNDIREKFEKGPLSGKNDRREECKQEIQNIRSRLFTGKQARIKEMYQQAVAEAEQGQTSVGKIEYIERSSDAQDIKERFEKGEFFKENSNEHSLHDTELFNAGIGKASRNIFMELDAHVLTEKQQQMANKSEISHNNLYKKCITEVKEPKDVIKSDEQIQDVVIDSEDIVTKFKFFERYRPQQQERKQFRMTPPREGVVKLPSPEAEADDNEEIIDDMDSTEKQLLERSNTTAKMLNKFRAIEKNQFNKQNSSITEPKPLKRFTPPLEDNRRVYASDENTEDETDTTPDDDDEFENEDRQVAIKAIMNDSALKEAQAAARAKILRAKFEKWEAVEMAREAKEQQFDVYSKDVSDETNIESTKSIRDRFERMQTEERLREPTKPRYQVNRFI